MPSIPIEKYNKPYTCVGHLFVLQYTHRQRNRSKQMKVTRKSAGAYNITLHGHTFKLEKLCGDRYWTLSNADDTEINRCETKSGMLELMSSWSAERAHENAQASTCYYA
jgi:hypothetical protein